MLSPDRRDLVLIHHKKLGIWVQPGGHVEPSDEDLLGAARREVLEEVGLSDLEPLPSPGGSPLFDVDIHAIPARKADPAHEHFDVRFAFVAQDARARALRRGRRSALGAAVRDASSWARTNPCCARCASCARWSAEGG